MVRLSLMVLVLPGLQCLSAQQLTRCFELAGNLNPTDLMTHLTSPCRYDRLVRPDPSGDGTAVNVHVRVQLFFLGDVNSQTFRFTAHTLIMHRWQDPRLAYLRNSTQNRAVPITYQEAFLSLKIWMPQPFIKNELDASVLGPEKKDVKIILHPDGTVQRLQRIKMTLSCIMALHKFPFDKQICSIIFQSWLYDKNEMNLVWEKNDPILVNANLKLAEFQLTGVEAIEPVSNPQQVLDHSADGNLSIHGRDIFDEKTHNFSVLEMKLYLSRGAKYYVMKFYIPSILLVFMSWITFWLDPNAIPGRTVLGSSTMLSLITMNINTGNSLSKVSTFKISEVWFVVCAIFIVASLLEFALVNTIWRRTHQVILHKVDSRHIFKSTLNLNKVRHAFSSEYLNKDIQSWTDAGPKKNANNSISLSNSTMRMISASSSSSVSGLASEVCNKVDVTVPTDKTKVVTQMSPREVARWIDVRCRIWFPVTFGVCNMLYWGFLWI